MEHPFNPNQVPTPPPSPAMPFVPPQKAETAQPLQTPAQSSPAYQAPSVPIPPPQPGPVYYSSVPQYAAVPAVTKPKQKGRGYAIAGMVLSILSLLTCMGILSDFISFFLGELTYFDGLISTLVELFVLVVLALVFSGVSRLVGHRGAQSVVGLILGTISSVVFVLGIVLLFLVF